MIYLYGTPAANMIKFFDNIALITNSKIIIPHIMLMILFLNYRILLSISNEIKKLKLS